MYKEKDINNFLFSNKSSTRSFFDTVYILAKTSYK